MDPQDLDFTPVRAPPSGEISDFINPVSRSHEIVLVISITLPLVIILTILRIYTRVKVTHFFGLDDCETPYAHLHTTRSTDSAQGFVLRQRLGTTCPSRLMARLCGRREFDNIADTVHHLDIHYSIFGPRP